MLNRLLASSLALTLSTMGMSLCVGMDMGTSGASGHVCSDAGTRPGAVGDAPLHDAPMPEPDCCVLDSAQNSRLRAERIATSAASVSLPVPSALAAGFNVHVRPSILVRTADPPGSASLARHLFFCVFLI